MERGILAAVLAAALAAPAGFAGDGDAPPQDDPAKAIPGAKADAPLAKAPPKKDDPAKEPAKETPKDAPKDPGAAAKAGAADAVATARSPRSKAEGLRILGQIVVSVNFDGASLPDALRYLSALAGVNIVVGGALRKEADVDAMKIDLRLTKVTARQVLELVADGKDLGIGFQSGVLTVTTRKEARGKPVLRLYALGDMTMPLRDFPAPDLMLHPAGAETKEEEVVETKHPFGDADEILRMVKDNTGSGTWEDEGVSASVMRDWLVVKQYEEVHAEIGKLLGLLRSAR
jgi:hypothetical protein